LPKFFIAAARTNFHGQNLLYYQGIVNVLRAIMFYNYLILFIKLLGLLLLVAIITMIVGVLRRSKILKIISIILFGIFIYFVLFAYLIFSLAGGTIKIFNISI